MKATNINDSMQIPKLDSIEDYRKRFMNCNYWQPYVQTVCSRHGFKYESNIRIGIPGTYPVFIVEDKWIVKFFGRLFNGRKTFYAELDANTLVTKDKSIPSPALVAQGYLFDDRAEWRWPYLIFDFVAGVGLSAVQNEVTLSEKVTIAQKLGKTVKRIHSLSLNEANFLKPNWENYIKMLEKNRIVCSERHKQWGELPEQILNQIDEFLLPTEKLVDRTQTPMLLHADLTAEHILLLDSDRGWQFNALIDWGDAIVGDFLFELIPLYLDMFQCDKKLLSAFLNYYGFDREFDHDIAVKMLNLCLLHPFNVFEDFFEKHPEAMRLSSLDEFAEWLHLNP